MGSIPTRPRHSRAPLLVAALAGALIGVGSPCAAEAPQDSTTVGRAGGFSSPFWVMMRSAAVPGWGQAHNGKWIKALLLGGAEAGFLYGVVQEDRWASDALRKARERPLEAEAWERIAEDHRDRKRDYLWWGAFALLLSVGDAYVDAHLRGFDIEFRDEDEILRMSIEVPF